MSSAGQRCLSDVGDHCFDCLGPGGENRTTRRQKARLMPASLQLRKERMFKKPRITRPHRGEDARVFFFVANNISHRGQADHD